MNKIYICYFGKNLDFLGPPIADFDKAMKEAKEGLPWHDVCRVTEYTLIDGEYVETAEHKLTND